MNNEFIEGLPSNGIKVIVAECQDPSTFWITNLSLFEDPSQKNKCNELENELADCQQLKLPCFENHLIEVGELVTVKHPETSTWCRGKVCDIFQKQSKYFYKVFLVDRGYPVVCIRDNLRNLPHAFKSQPFATYPIRLSNIIPRDFEERCYRTAFSSFWTREAFNLVTKLIAEGEGHYFVPQLTKHILCGDLYVRLDDNFVNIGDELCKAGLAFKNATIFKSSLNLSETEQMLTEFDFCKSIGNNAQCEFPDKDNVDEMDTCIHHEMDVTKNKGLGRGKIRMLLENSRQEYKPVKRNSELKVSYINKHPLLGIKNDFSKHEISHKISMGRGEHLKILQQLSQQYRQKSNPCKNNFFNIKDQPMSKFDDDQEMLASLFETKLKCNQRNPSTVPFIPAGAESSVLQRIILKRNS